MSVPLALALVMTLATPEPRAPIFELGMVAGDRVVPILTIDADGHWTAVKDVRGQLGPAERDRIAEAAERVVLNTSRVRDCSAVPTLQVLRVPRREVRYAMSCGPAAHASVHALVALAESLTVRRPDPVLLRLRRWRAGDEARVQVIHLMRNGEWTTERGRGTLPPAQLASIITALDAALLEAPPTPEAPYCRGDLLNTLEVPGRGDVQWLWPCAKPSPSLAAALALVETAVGARRP